MKKIQLKNGQILNFQRVTLQPERELTEKISSNLYEDMSSFNAAHIVECFRSENNLYLEKLALRAIRSVTHSDCLRVKTRYSTGSDIIGYNEEGEEDDVFNEYLKMVNVNGQNMHEVAVKEHYNDWLFGNSYLELVKIADKIYIYAKDATTIRAKKPKGFDVDTWVYAPDWTQIDEYGNTTEKKFEWVEYPNFPNFGKVAVRDRDGVKKEIDGERCIIQFRFDVPRFDVYGLPDYVAAINDIDLEYKIGAYNLDEFANSFQADVMMTFFSDTEDEEAARELKDTIEKEYTGEGKNGKPMVRVNQNDAKSPEIHEFHRRTDGNFETLSERIFRNISRAHGIPLSLLSNAMAGKLGNCQELRNEYELFLNTIIKPYQESKCRHYKKIWRVCKEKGATNIPEVPEYVKFKTTPPFSFIDGIKAERHMLTSEVREYLNLPELSDEEIQEIKENQRNNGTTNNREQRNQ